MKRTTLAIAALVVVASALAVALWIGREGPEAALTAPATTAEHDAARADAALVAGAEAQDVDAAPGDAPRDARRPLAAPEAEIAAPAAADDELATIRGRCVLADGSPAAGVAWKVHGWVGNQDRLIQHGEPEDWVDPAGATQPDGTFVARFDPPRAYQFVLDIKAPGYAEESWRWGEIPPGATKDVGDVVMERGGAIAGALVDADGEPLRQSGWMVYADAVATDPGEGRDQTRTRASVDPATGRFRLEDMPPGPAKLNAYSSMANWIDGPRVTVVAGDTVETQIRYEGPDNARRITVSTFSRPFYVMTDPEPGSIALYGAGPEALVAQKIEGSSQSWSFDDLDPGSYRIEIDDERYLPWSRDGVTPGTDVSAHLSGNVRLALDVRDHDTGEPVDLYAVRVEFRNVTFSPREFEVHAGAEPLPGGVVEGMFPGDYRVAVRAPGYPPAAVDVEGLVANETRTVSVLVGDAIELAGRVVRGDGSPAAGIEVQLLEPAAANDSPSSDVLPRGASSSNESEMRRELDTTEADTRGRFRFTVAAAGTYAVRAETPAGLAAATKAYAVTAGGSRTDLELVVPIGGWVEGRITGPQGASFDGLQVHVTPTDRDAARRVTFDERLYFDLAPDGSFRAGPLAPGLVAVALAPPRFESQGMSFRPQGVDLGTVLVPDGGVAAFEASVIEAFPGTVALAVLHGSEPARHVRVTLEDAEGAAQWFTAHTDPNGRVGPLHVSPGAWTIRVSSDAEAWVHVHPAPVVVEPGRDASAEIGFETAEGSIEVRGANDEPLAGATLLVLRAADVSADPVRSFFVSLSAMRSSTDAEGRVRLVLTPGEYVVRTAVAADNPFDAIANAPAEDPLEGALVWTLSGPDRAVVRLE